MGGWMDYLADSAYGKEERGEESGEDKDAPPGAKAFGAEKDAMQRRRGGVMGRGGRWERRLVGGGQVFGLGVQGCSYRSGLYTRWVGLKFRDALGRSLARWCGGESVSRNTLD